MDRKYFIDEVCSVKICNFDWECCWSISSIDRGKMSTPFYESLRFQCIDHSPDQKRDTV